MSAQSGNKTFRGRPPKIRTAAFIGDMPPGSAAGPRFGIPVALAALVSSLSGDREAGLPLARSGAQPRPGMD